jgi:DNA-binding FadR family transcriptional regulator
MNDKTTDSRNLARAKTLAPMRTARSDTLRGQSFIRVPKTAEIVAGDIRRRIVTGQLREGDFLPPEAALIASLGISRPTLREAFRILEAEHLITVVRGSRSGARVHAPKVGHVARYAGYALQAQGTTTADIYEARLAIEPYLVRRLAKSRTATDLAQLRAEAERVQALTDAGRHTECMIALAQFHALLVELCGNRTLFFITCMLRDVVARHQVEFLRDHVLPIEEQRLRLLWGIRSFHKLIGLLEAGDADRAESHWRVHIINANAAWVPAEESHKVIDALG